MASKPRARSPAPTRRARLVILTVHEGPDFVPAAFDADALGDVVNPRLADVLKRIVKP